jgi:hypothetical protein
LPGQQGWQQGQQGLAHSAHLMVRTSGLVLGRCSY